MNNKDFDIISVFFKNFKNKTQMRGFVKPVGYTDTFYSYLDEEIDDLLDSIKLLVEPETIKGVYDWQTNEYHKFPDEVPVLPLQILCKEESTQSLNKTIRKENK